MRAESKIVLASGAKDNSVRVWNETGACLAVGQGHAGAVSALAFSRRALNFLVSGGVDKLLKVRHAAALYTPAVPDMTKGDCYGLTWASSDCSSGQGMLKNARWASRSGMCPSSWTAAQERARKARRPDCELQPLSLPMTRTSMRWQSHLMTPSSALHHKTALPRQDLLTMPVSLHVPDSRLMWKK